MPSRLATPTYGVLSALTPEKTLAPKPIAARLVVPDVPWGFGPAKAVLSPAALLLRQELSCSHLLGAGPLHCPRGDTELALCAPPT
jgi:hypothetical protein